MFTGEAVVTWHMRRGGQEKVLKLAPPSPVEWQKDKGVTVRCVAAPVRTYIPVKACFKGLWGWVVDVTVRDSEDDQGKPAISNLAPISLVEQEVKLTLTLKRTYSTLRAVPTVPSRGPRLAVCGNDASATKATSNIYT